MKPKLLFLILALGLGGCAVSPESRPGRQAWEVRPVVDVRHGMAKAAAYYQLGAQSEKQGDPGAAERHYEQALATDPSHVDSLNALGRRYAARGDLERSSAMFRRVGEQAPQRAYLFNNIGYAYYLQGRYGEAVEAFRQALALDAGYDRAWANLRSAARKGGMNDVLAMAERRSLLPAPGSIASASEVPAAAVEVKELAVAERLASQALVEAPSVTSVVAAKTAALVTVPARRAPMALRMVEVPARLLPWGATVQTVTVGGERLSAVRQEPMPALPAVRAVRVGQIAGSPMPPARVEVANGNGISGFAKRFRVALDGEGIKVVRTTNFSSFAVPSTIIEYQPGFADAAQALKAHIGRPMAIREATAGRPGTDLRVILGRDWRLQV